ncbi:uncharacterized protein SETTUDRAFT_152805 [Exserohilum turcica Et28A]|uniref:Uncharacterized protein n=1 Tax=Exserohilum turcicum (strain 28A) TaxID=671987 RepID=R0KFZ7_EXST2|nr:uncharacterized protein SETTUDRAFT_152805 [Exserohilum turcica Et28A]EOA91763.1 hypothetical protein SETTUDRAFT_152805 [Exserohilum turcica Et28A]
MKQVYLTLYAKEKKINAVILSDRVQTQANPIQIQFKSQTQNIPSQPNPINPFHSIPFQSSPVQSNPIQSGSGCHVRLESPCCARNDNNNAKHP